MKARSATNVPCPPPRNLHPDSRPALAPKCVFAEGTFGDIWGHFLSPPSQPRGAEVLGQQASPGEFVHVRPSVSRVRHRLRLSKSVPAPCSAAATGAIPPAHHTIATAARGVGIFRDFFGDDASAMPVSIGAGSIVGAEVLARGMLPGRQRRRLTGTVRRERLNVTGLGQHANVVRSGCEIIDDVVSA